MIIILRYDLPTKTIREIEKMDLSGDDKLDMINQKAISEDRLHGVWHFADKSNNNIEKVLTKLWKEELFK